MERARAEGGVEQGPRRGTTPRALIALQRALDATERVSRAAYCYATRRPVVRERLRAGGRVHTIDRARSTAYAHTAPTMTLTRQLAQIWDAGATVAELLRIAEVPRQAVVFLTHEVVRGLNVLDQAETALDGREDEFQMRRRIHGEQPASCPEEANLCEEYAALYLERAIALRHRAAGLESTGGLVA